MNVLSIDPSFTATGYAVLKVDTKCKMSLVTWGWIRTNKGKKTPVTIDDMFRAQQIAAKLDDLVTSFSITHLYSEVPLGTMSAISAKGLSIAKGVVAVIAQVKSLTTTYINPFRVKKTVCGNNHATKEEIIAAVEIKFPELGRRDKRLKRDGKSFTPEHEAICDAVAIALAIQGGGAGLYKDSQPVKFDN